VAGLDVSDKSHRVARFQRETVHSFFDVLGAAGLKDPSELKPWYVQRRVSAYETRSYATIYPQIELGSLLSSPPTGIMANVWQVANADAW